MPHSHHSHSGQFCRHAKDKLEDIVKEAIRQGFEVYGLTEHAPRYRLEDLYPEELDLSLDDLQAAYNGFLAEATRLKAKYADQISLVIGLESDFITKIDLEETLSLFESRTEIDYIVGSVHHVNGIPIDFDRDTWLRAVYAAGQGDLGSMMEVDDSGSSRATRSVTANTSILQLRPGYSPPIQELRPFILAYLDQQLHMIQTLRPEVIGHFDLFRLWTPDLDVRDPQLNPAGDRGVWEAIQRNVEKVVRYGGLFELNTAAFRKGWDTAYPSRPIAQLIIQSGGQFCLSDDSHGIAQVGLNYRRLQEYMQSLAITEVSYIVPRQRGRDSSGAESSSVSQGRHIDTAERRILVRRKADLWAGWGSRLA